MAKFKKAAAQRVAKSFSDKEVVELRKSMANGEVGDRFLDLSKAIDELGELETKLAPFKTDMARLKQLKDYIRDEFNEFKLENYAGEQYFTKAVKTAFMKLDEARVKIHLGKRLKDYMKQSWRVTLTTELK